MKGRRWVLTAAVLVAGIRLWMQVRGKTKTPFNEWAIGWGVVFFFLALLADSYPQAAGPLAGTVVVGDFLANGASLFEDISGAVTGAVKGNVLVDSPFGGGASAQAATGPQAPPRSTKTVHTVPPVPTVAQAPLHTMG